MATKHIIILQVIQPKCLKVYDKVNEVNGCKQKTWGGKQEIPEALG